MWIPFASIRSMNFLAVVLASLVVGIAVEGHESHTPLRKVFGVGLSKTGTTSLGNALEMLGYRNIHNDRAFVPFLSSSPLSNTHAFNFSRYDNVDAVEDIPTAFYYNEMMQVNLNSSFSLILYLS